MNEAIKNFFRGFACAFDWHSLEANPEVPDTARCRDCGHVLITLRFRDVAIRTLPEFNFEERAPDAGAWR